jgi:hypothetical protein
MDNTLGAQIIFANEKAFDGISDAKKCLMLSSVCKAAKENQHIISVITKNRAELYAIRIFNYLLKKSKRISRKENHVEKIISSVDIMFNRETYDFRSYFVEHILLDYIDILNHFQRYKKGFERCYYRSEIFHPFILYNYMTIINDVTKIDFEKEVISLKLRKLEEAKDTWRSVEYSLWSIEDILKIHNNIPEITNITNIP